MDPREHSLRKTLGWLVAAVCLSLLVAGASPALAQEEPSISIDPTSGPCGTLIEVTGEGFEPDVAVFVLALAANHILGFENMEPPATTDAAGRFVYTVEMPTFGSSCVSPGGMIVFVCPQPLCEPKLRVPFEATTTAAEFPSTGGGADSTRWTPLAVVASVAFAGIGVLLLGMAGVITTRAGGRRDALD